MSDSDIQFKDIGTSTKKPRHRERANSVAEAVHGISNESGSQINPSREETLLTLGTKLDSVITAIGSLLTDTQLRASTVPVSVSNVMTEATGVAIKNAITNLNDFQETVFTSADGNTVYFRRALYSETNDTIVISWTDVSGSAISTPSGAVPLKSNTNVDTDVHYFDVTANGTGYSIGNIIARIVIVNLATGLPTSTVYYNLSTSATITPVLGDLVLQDQNVKASIVSMPVTSPTLSAQQAGNTTLSSILTSLGLLATETNLTTLINKNEAIRLLLAGVLKVSLPSDQDPVFDHDNAVKISLNANASTLLITPSAGCKYIRINPEIDVYINTANGTASDGASNVKIMAGAPEVVPVTPGTTVNVFCLTPGVVRATPLKAR